MPDHLLHDRYEFARHVAWEAGKLTLRHFGKDVQVDRKEDHTPVTVADRDVEKLLRQRIGDQFPRDGILGEEFGETKGSSGFRWILDPIDGTKSFISGVPLYGTMVGVEHDGEAVIGVVAFPALHVGMDAARGQGAWQIWSDGERSPARVSSATSLSEGLLATTEFSGYEHRRAANAFHELCQAAWFSRTWGDCYGYYLVATGRALAMIDPVMSIWDAAALKPVLEEAGGTFTDWQGVPTINGGEGVGTNRHVLDEVLAVTRRYPRP
jgi:histidinol phosphatase-like enzyme (inositol monophosphatase family)